eukprot:TRINITY_DN17216_c0_g1_i1.p1 TRINITY_DN17216_c0_g1~~TRINITY_DN17216_c0_g1_i1.p1  ORF type:complete len:149 (+),score=22.58 TRINITY_DN17216_c0_g1_i1:157-603(+)
MEEFIFYPLSSYLPTFSSNWKTSLSKEDSWAFEPLLLSLLYVVDSIVPLSQVPTDRLIRTIALRFALSLFYHLSPSTPIFLLASYIMHWLTPVNVYTIVEPEPPKTLTNSFPFNLFKSSEPVIDQIEETPKSKGDVSFCGVLQEYVTT